MGKKCRLFDPVHADRTTPVSHSFKLKPRASAARMGGGLAALFL
jgi:hypothetical protein